jgi:uncharacterized protein (TIGR02391 family)
MPTIPKINESHLEAICDILGDTGSGLTGSEIGKFLIRCSINDPEPSLSKRVRLFVALRQNQTQDNCANIVLSFIQTAMDPVRFVGRAQEFIRFRNDLNEALAFAGWQLAEDAKLRIVEQASTLTMAQQRAGRLRSKLIERKVHHGVLQFCRAELLQENFFHAVFEATKSVAQKIRDKTGLTGDGAQIADEALNISAPLLAINTLRSETEQSEQKGFANLMKGMFGTFRDVTGHVPKIAWPIKEEDALDLLSLVSYLHRRLDDAAVIRRATP